MRTRMMVALVVGMFVWAGSASAQAGGVRVSAPFGFGVGGKSFAAGDYIIMAGSHQVRIVSEANGKTLAMALANDVSGHSAGANGRIVFRCYGDRCYLWEVWSPVEQNGRQVLSSHGEAHSNRERGGTYFAILGKPGK